MKIGVTASETCSLRTLRAGGPEMHEEFVRTHYVYLFRWLHWLCGEEEEAADLTQDTFVAFWCSLGNGPESAEARAWLFSIGRNVWRNAIRRHHRARRNLGNQVADIELQDRRPGSGPEGVMADECVAEIRKAVVGLAPSIREVVTLRYWAGCSYAEIAEVVSISPELARQRVFQGRKVLRRKLAAWAPDIAKGTPTTE